MTTPPRASVYIDGFNLYYSIRSTANKWLDLEALSDRMLPGRQVTNIRYFTARVKPFDDPQAPSRQQAYFRALSTLPRVSKHEGSFQVYEHSLPLSEDGSRRAIRNGGTAGTRVPVLKAEEKGSDVNIATHLLIDAFGGDFEEAVVVSNDTDLIEPIRYVSKVMKRPVWLMSARGRPSARLVAAGNGHILLTHPDFAACQFPDPVWYGQQNKVSKPAKWSTPPRY